MNIECNAFIMALIQSLDTSYTIAASSVIPFEEQGLSRKSNTITPQAQQRGYGMVNATNCTRFRS
jgi:hypothetical protein